MLGITLSALSIWNRPFCVFLELSFLAERSDSEVENWTLIYRNVTQHDITSWSQQSTAENEIACVLIFELNDLYFEVGNKVSI